MLHSASSSSELLRRNLRQNPQPAQSRREAAITLTVTGGLLILVLVSVGLGVGLRPRPKQLVDFGPQEPSMLRKTTPNASIDSRNGSVELAHGPGSGMGSLSYRLGFVHGRASNETGSLQEKNYEDLD